MQAFGSAVESNESYANLDCITFVVVVIASVESIRS